jgi:hypothetical protein
MCKFGWILLISLGGVVDKRWITTSDLENLYFDVRNHKKLKNKYDNKCTLDVWEKIVKKCG